MVLPEQVGKDRDWSLPVLFNFVLLDLGHGTGIDQVCKEFANNHHASGKIQ
jgi:hypothetical protein